MSAGLTKAGQIIAFMTYFTLMLNAVISVGRIFVMYSKGIASSRRICEVLNAPADLLTEEIDLEGSSEADSDRAQIRFEHVSFSYDGGKVLDDVSFSIGKGEPSVSSGYRQRQNYNHNAYDEILRCGRRQYLH